MNEQIFDFYKKIKELINDYDIISFDIFDTLIIRKFFKPDDVWLYIQEKTNILNFFEFRSKYNASSYETLDDVYNKMPQSLKYIKDIEIDLEIQCAEQNPFMLEILNAAKDAGKIVILASDMYLNIDTIQKILNKCNIYKYDKLYLSNNMHIRKDDGTMFNRILNDFKEKKILHIGDNVYSDYIIPKQLGIDAINIIPMTTLYLNDNIFIKKFLQEKPTLNNRIFVQLLVLGYMNLIYSEKLINYWSKLSCKIGVALVVSYAQFIFNNIKKNNIDCLLFISRDGYVLKKLFDQISNIKSMYVYAPRYVFYTNDICIKNEYQKYVDNLNINDCNCAIVDTITRNHTSQKLFQNALHKNILMFAYATFNSTQNNILSYTTENCYTNHFIEFIFSAPHATVKEIKNFKPIFKQNLTNNENLLIDIQYKLSKYIVNCSKYVFKQLQLFNIDITSADIKTYLNLFLSMLTEDDKQNLYKIKHDELTDTNNTKCDNIII